MSTLGVGKRLAELKKRIAELHTQIQNLDSQPADISEMIDSANLIRSNDHLMKSDALKSELVMQYDQYTKNLEGLLYDVLDIQNDLTDILHEQSKLLSKTRSKTR